MSSELNNAFSALGLSDSIVSALTAVGYEEPSPIQSQAIPLILEGHDLIGQAQTGTGKTAAFALPILQLINTAAPTPQALILAPTRELAIQVAAAFESYAVNMPRLKVVPIYGGAPMGNQLKLLKQGAQVVVATPGRLVDHLSRNSSLLQNIRWLILDEADEMLKLGFMDDLEAIFAQLPVNRQTILFSATLSSSIKQIAEQHLKQPKHVKIASKTQTVAQIEQSFVLVPNELKNRAISRILEVESFDGLIGFVRTKQATLEIAAQLEKQGYKVAALNGDIVQAQRERVIEALKDGSINIVIATDVAARGIDVPRITHVLNIDMPYDPESYVHRIGRTGRAGRDGKAILLVTPREKRMLQTLQRVTGQKITETEIPKAESVLSKRIENLSKQLSNMLPVKKQVNEVFKVLMERLECDDKTLGEALLALATMGKSFDVHAIEKEIPAFSSGSDRTSSGRGDSRGEGRSESRDKRRDTRSSPPRGANHSVVLIRASVGLRDGVAVKNLLGAILNEGGISKESLGKIQIRDTFSLVELPEQGLESLMSKLSQTRVSGKLLRLRRYEE